MFGTLGRCGCLGKCFLSINCDHLYGYVYSLKDAMNLWFTYHYILVHIIVVVYLSLHIGTYNSCGLLITTYWYI